MFVSFLSDCRKSDRVGFLMVVCIWADKDGRAHLLVLALVCIALHAWRFSFLRKVCWIDAPPLPGRSRLFCRKGRFF